MMMLCTPSSNRCGLPILASRHGSGFARVPRPVPQCRLLPLLLSLTQSKARPENVTPHASRIDVHIGMNGHVTQQNTAQFSAASALIGSALISSIVVVS